MSPLAHSSLSLSLSLFLSFSLSSRITWRDPHAYKTLPLNHEYLHIAKRRGRGRDGSRRMGGKRDSGEIAVSRGAVSKLRYTRDAQRVVSKRNVYKIDYLFFFFFLSLFLFLSLSLSLFLSVCIVRLSVGAHLCFAKATIALLPRKFE